MIYNDHFEALPAPGCRALACRVPESIAEVGLVRETALQGDLAQRSVAREHHRLSPVEAPADGSPEGSAGGNRA